MSSTGKILSYAAGYVLIVFVAGLAVLSLLAGLMGWLIPIATAGAVHVGYIQAVSILVLAILGLLLARLVLK
jgi:hypothetical protein